MNLLCFQQDGDTPLMGAAYNGHEQVVKKLFSSGASPALTDKVGIRMQKLSSCMVCTCSTPSTHVEEFVS